MHPQLQGITVKLPTRLPEAALVQPQCEYSQPKHASSETVLTTDLLSQFV